MIRILAFVEADNVSGPAKNLLALSRQFRSAGLPIEIQIATFYRAQAACSVPTNSCGPVACDPPIERLNLDQ